MSFIAEKRDELLKEGIELGNSVTPEKNTPNLVGSYQEFEQGIIFYHPSYGAHYLSKKVMDKWKSASVANTHSNQRDKLRNFITVQNYLGFPTSDTGKNRDGAEVCFFEKGMIICLKSGQSYVIYGSVFTKYVSTQGRGSRTQFPSWVGYPIADVAVNSMLELIGKFHNADIYGITENDAYEIHGSIRTYYNQLSTVRSKLGTPISDEQAIIKNGVEVGRSNDFKNGKIYWSVRTGARALWGDFAKYYASHFKILSDELGLPTSNELMTPSGKRYVNFEKGILVQLAPNTEIKKITELSVILTKLETDEDDDDLYVKSSVSVTLGGREIAKFHKDYGEYEDQGTKDNFTAGEALICKFPINDGNVIITVHMKAWDMDGGLNFDDDIIAELSKSFSIDTFWDTVYPDLSGKSLLDWYNGPDGKFRAFFKIQNNSFGLPNPYDSANFRKNLWWDIRNFGESTPLSREMYASTFSDVEQDESTLFNPFNAIYYEAYYKSMGKGGHCFGFSLEAIFALKNRSAANQPISQYKRMINDRPDRFIEYNFRVNQGSQASSAKIFYEMQKHISGEKWNPVLNFHRSREMFAQGDFPIILVSNQDRSSGHAVLPYAWAENGNTLIISIADPNKPVYLDANSPNDVAWHAIIIDKEKQEFRFRLGMLNDMPVDWIGGKGVNNGGYFYTIPYSALSTPFRTPAAEIGAALIGLGIVGVATAPLGGAFLGVLSAVLGFSLIITGGASEVEQVEDGRGRIFFDEPLYRTRRRKPKIKYLIGLPKLEVNDTSKPTFFAHKSTENDPTIYSPNATDRILKFNKWQVEQIATAIYSKDFALNTNIQNYKHYLSQDSIPVISQMLENFLSKDGHDSLNFTLKNIGNTKYSWTMATRHAQIQFETNCIAESRDNVIVENINTGGQSITFINNEMPDGEPYKEKILKTSLVSFDKNRVFSFDNINLIPQEPVSFQHNNACKQILVYNANNPTNVDVYFYINKEEKPKFILLDTPLLQNSITVFEAISENTVKKEVYERVGEEPISSVTYSTIQIDCRLLIHEWLVLANTTDGVGLLSINAPQDKPDSGGWFYCHDRIAQFVVEDGTYFIAVQSGTNTIIEFSVKEGKISYNSKLEGVVTGAHTNTLVLNGLDLTIDATAVRNMLIYLPAVYGMDGIDTNRASRPKETGRFLPTSHDGTDGWDYGFVIDSGVAASFTFKFCIDGKARFDSRFDPVVNGNGTDTLQILELLPQ